MENSVTYLSKRHYGQEAETKITIKIFSSHNMFSLIIVAFFNKTIYNNKELTYLIETFLTTIKRTETIISSNCL